MLCFVDIKIREAIRKSWNRAIRAVLRTKSRQSTRQLLYYCNLLSASFRIDYLQPDLLHYLKTCLHNNVLKVCSSVATYDTKYNNLLKKYVMFSADSYLIKKAVWLKFSIHSFP